MSVPDDTQSWKDRCNRYFTSITDAEGRTDDRSVTEDKDERTEKAEKANAKHHDADTWHDLSAIRKRFQGNAFTRYVRRTLGVIDIHGAKIASKSGNVGELVVWLILILGAITALVILLYMHVSRRIDEDDVRYDVTEITTLPQMYDRPSITLCNLNILKRSSVSGTHFQNIINIDSIIINNNNNANANTDSNNNPSLDDMLNANAKLANFIHDSGTSKSELIAELNDDVLLEILRSGGSVTDRLKALESPEMLRSYLQPGRAELELHGHGVDGMIVQCWIGGRRCRSGELTDHVDTGRGKCVRVGAVGTREPETVRLLLDVQSAEYINVLSPTVGISVSVRDPHAGADGTVAAVAVKGTRLVVETQEIRVTERVRGDCRAARDYDRQVCLTKCLDSAVRAVCGCSHLGVTDVSRCNNDVPAQYVCVKTIQHLSITGLVSCTCPEKCRTIDHVTTASTAWLSDPAIEQMRKHLAAKGVGRNVTDIRRNLVEVVVNMKPWKQIVYKENNENTLLSLLAQVGGLSALVAGVSILTVIELLWTAVRAVWHGAVHYRRRSSGTGAVHRLTESEITSITWAMFRQRRMEEERVNSRATKGKKKKDRQDNYIFTGNVQSRITRLNSYRTHDNENTYENNNNKYIAHDGSDARYEPRRENPDIPHEGQTHMFQRAGNGRSRSTDFSGRQASYQAHREQVYTRPPGHMDNGFTRVGETGSMERKYSASGGRYVDHSVSMISRNIPQEEVGRPSNSMLLVDMAPQYTPAGMYSDRGRIIMPADPLQQYGGPAAHFHTNMISEPMYL